MEVGVEIPKRIPKEELTQWSKTWVDNLSSYPIGNINQEFEYWRSLTPQIIEEKYERFHHTAIYAMCVFLNKLPRSLKMNSVSGRNQTSLNGEEKKSLENFFFMNREQILKPIEEYVYANFVGADVNIAG